MNLIEAAVRKVSNKPTDFPKFKAGDTLGVHVKVKEGEKERIQLFKGIVIKIQGSGVGRSFTVRKVSEGIGVERTFPLNSPTIDRIELHSHGIVRRSRLFYLRALKGKASRVKSELALGSKKKKAAPVAAKKEEAPKATATSTEKPS